LLVVLGHGVLLQLGDIQVTAMILFFKSI